MRCFLTCLICCIAAATYAEDPTPFRGNNALWGYCRPAPGATPKTTFDDLLPSYGFTGEEVIPAQYRWVGFFRDGLARVTREGRFDPPKVGIFGAKWGFIDPTGREIAALQFSSATDFSKGYARVELNGKWGVLDKSGEFVVPAKYGKVRHFSERRIGVLSKEGWGFCDDTGTEVVPCRYTKIDDFYNGFARVMHDGKRAWLSLDGSELAFGEYDHLMPFDENLAPAKYNSKWGYADTQGNLAIAPQWDGAGRFMNGLAVVTREKKQGYIDTTGAIVIEPQFMWAGQFGKEGLAVVQESKDSFAFIHRDGQYAFPQRFKRANEFHNGVASVVFNGRWYNLGVTGSMVAPEWTGQFAMTQRAGEKPADSIFEWDFSYHDFDN